VSEKSQESLAAHVLEMYPVIREDLESTLGWKLESKPIVRLVGSKDMFERMSGSSHIAAFAVPAQDLIVMHVSPVTTVSSSFSLTLKHELCHLFLHEHIRASHIPKWLDEGVCQWVSGSLGELLAGGGFPDMGVAIARHPIPLRQLAYSFPADGDSLFLAYEESRRFVDYLTTTYGKESLLGILQLLREGDDIDMAVSKTLSKSLETLEEEWLESVRGRGLWLIWLSQHLYDILFFIAALLTVAAAIVTALRNKRYVGEEEEEE
jgi:hypothetical protein